jgi:hypothetical protein
MDGTVALDVLQSFKEIMTQDDFTEFVKGADSEKLRAFPEVTEFLKGEMPEQFKKKEDKEPKEKDEKPGDKEDDKESDEDEDDEKEKAISSELIKGLQADVLSSNEKVETLQKSIDTLTGIVSKLSGMPMGTKAVKSGNANFFEKSFGASEQNQDDDGKRVLSITTQKETVLKCLEDGLSKAQDTELVKAYENSIMRYNAGGGTISREAAVDLFENHGIRLTQ